MQLETINLNINDVDFEAVVEFVPATYVPAKLLGLPEDCHPDESEDMIINSLHMVIDDNKQDLSFLIDSLEDDIKEQLSD